MLMVKRDLQFFIKQDLMDYSMIVAIKQVDKMYATIPFENTKPCMNMYNSFKVWHGDKLYIVYVGIIDFLQGWTTGKRVAHIIKCIFAPKPISTVHPVIYAEQFENSSRRSSALKSTRGKNKQFHKKFLKSSLCSKLIYIS